MKYSTIGTLPLFAADAHANYLAISRTTTVSSVSSATCCVAHSQPHTSRSLITSAPRQAKYSSVAQLPHSAALSNAVRPRLQNVQDQKVNYVWACGISLTHN